MKKILFTALLIMLILVVCVGCTQNNSFDTENSHVNDTTDSTVNDTTPDDIEPEYIEDFFEKLPSHLHKINGLYYLDLPEKVNVENTGGASESVSAPSINFDTLDELKQTVYANSFSEEHKAILAQMEGDLGRKLCIPNLSKLDKVAALSMIEQQWCTFGEEIGVRGVPKNNLYGNESVTFHYYNSEDSCNSYSERFVYSTLQDYGYETVEYKGETAKKVEVTGFSVQYIYEYSKDGVESIIRIGYLIHENTLLTAPNTISVIVKNNKTGMYFRCHMGGFEKDPPLEWILQFAEIAE